MANSKISALTSATTPVAGTETLPIVQSGVTKQVSIANLTVGRAVTTLSVNSTGPNGIPITLQEITALPSSATAAYVGVTTSAFPGGANGDVVIIPRTSSNNDVRIYVGSGTPTESLIVQASTKDIRAGAGNFVPATAGKGVNFTANTALSGKTSQLLNWYEEGTFTPTWNGGTVTTNSSYYTRVGRLVTWILDVTLGASASGTDSQLTLPFTSTGSWGGGSINYTDYGTGITVNVDVAGNRLYFRSAMNGGNLACSSVASKRFICVVTYFA